MIQSLHHSYPFRAHTTLFRRSNSAHTRCIRALASVRVACSALTNIAYRLALLLGSSMMHSNCVKPCRSKNLARSQVRPWHAKLPLPHAKRVSMMLDAITSQSRDAGSLRLQRRTSWDARATAQPRLQPSAQPLGQPPSEAPQPWVTCKRTQVPSTAIASRRNRPSPGEVASGGCQENVLQAPGSLLRGET